MREIKQEEKKGVTIYKTDGSILFQSDKLTIKEAVEDNKHNIRGASLCGIDLRGTDLRGASLCEIDFCGADLREIDFRGASLCGTDLRYADIYGVDFRGADLCSAKFWGKTSYPKKLKQSQVKDFLLALGFKIEE